MSVEWLTWAYQQRVGDAGAKSVLIALCNYANPINPCDKSLISIIPDALKGHIGKLGFCWPSQALLAQMTEMTDRTIRKHVSTLEEREFIVSFERRRPDGRKSSTGYLLITSPEIISGGTSPEDFDTTSPEESSGTYEDTQGLIQKEGIITPTCITEKKLPLPLFRVSAHLRDHDWAAVAAACVCKDGTALSRDYFVRQYDAWCDQKGLTPRYVLPHFLNFIHRHKERNKL